jgi:hypothetical protein
MEQEQVAAPEVTGITETVAETPEPSWRDSLGDDLRDNPSLSTIPDIGTLAKNYVETKSLVGKKGIIQPGENATPEEINEYHAKLGRPESPDKYEFAPPPDMPQEFPYSPDLEQGFRTKAHELGMSNKQAKELFDWYLTSNLEGFQTLTQQTDQGRVEAEKSLKSDWGKDYETNIEAANRVIRQYGDPIVQESIANKDPIWNDPKLARFLSSIGKAMGESDFVKGDTSAATSLEGKMKSLMADPAYLDKKDMRHNDVVLQVWNLRQQLNP